MRRSRIAFTLLISLALALLCAPAQAERRVALVIGNGAYKTAPLKNPTNDAQDMADALRGMGFDVTLKLNASLREMEEAVRSFGLKLKQGGLGLFYYAGHGVQVAGENYLIPVDSSFGAEADVKYGALNAGLALARMEDAGNDINIVILDACRNNPFARNFRSAEQGLARMDAPKGSLIAYATAPGRVAADSSGGSRNGLYTGFLLQQMRVPGQPVEQVFKRVRDAVMRTTNDRQVPWESTSLRGDLYFMSGVQTASIGSTITPVMNNLAIPEAQQAPQTSTTQAGLDADYYMGLREISNRNWSGAIKWFEKAAAKGDASAICALWHLTSKISLELKQSIQACRLSSEDGNAFSQYILGLLYSVPPDGIELDQKEAYKWLKKSAEHGFAPAQSFLAMMYDNGIGVQQDHVEAVKWYRKAADQGEDGAQYHIGRKYVDGSGVPLSETEAARFFKQAADQGNLIAQTELAYMYKIGLGVPKSSKMECELYKIAANGGAIGSQYAQVKLGEMYKNGEGIEKDAVLSYMYFSLAAAEDYLGAAKLRDEVASQMTTAQIAKAQRMAVNWRPQKRQLPPMQYFISWTDPPEPSVRTSPRGKLSPK